MLARQIEAADKSFRAALALNPKQPEVWNTLGILQLYRTPPRLQEAFLAFIHSTQQQPGYAPALFNAALVSHFYLPRRPVDQRPFALIDHEVRHEREARRHDERRHDPRQSPSK